MSIDASIDAVRFSKPIPLGWYSAGRLVDLPADLIATGDETGAVLLFQACAQELVAWHDGVKFRVADAFCPHLGAHHRVPRLGSPVLPHPRSHCAWHSVTAEISAFLRAQAKDDETIAGQGDLPGCPVPGKGVGTVLAQ
jgi:hypothetical protein